MNTEKQRSLVMGGSGTNLYVYIGAIEAMVLNGYSFDRIIGCSGGANIGVLFSAFNPKTKEDFDKLKNILLESIPYKAGLLDFTFDIFFHYGLVKGKRLRKFLRKILVPICDDRFESLPLDFTCVTTNVTKEEAMYVSRHENNGIRVSDAVYASMAFPGVFAPIQLHGDGDEFSDGGIVNNFPIDYFDGPVVGLKVVADQPNKRIVNRLGFFRRNLLKIRSFGISRRLKFVNFWLSIVNSMMLENERERIEDNPDAIVILLHAPKNSMNLFITKEEAAELMKSGFDQAEKYIKENRDAFERF